MKQMKITLDECLSLKSIEKVVINSYEQSLYLVSVIVNGEERFVTDDRGNFLKSFNKLELQKLFSNCKSFKFLSVQLQAKYCSFWKYLKVV